MPSLDSVFFFPRHLARLTPEDAVSALSRRDLEWDSTIRILERLEGTQLIADTGTEVDLVEPLVKDLATRLHSGQSFAADLRNHEIAFCWFFADLSANPHVDASWPRRWFDALSEDARREYLAMFCEFAKLSNAAYVVFVADPGEFEFRFLSVDGYRVLGSASEQQQCDRVIEIWIRSGEPEVLGFYGVRAGYADPQGKFAVFRAS